MKDEHQVVQEAMYKRMKDNDKKYQTWLSKSERDDNFANWSLFRLTGGIGIKKNSLVMNDRKL